MNSFTLPVLTLAAAVAFPSVALAQSSQAPPGAAPSSAPNAIDIRGEPEPLALQPVVVEPLRVASPIQYVVPPPPVIPRRRAEFGIAIDYVRLPFTAYNQAVRLWGYEGFYNAAQVSTHALGALARWFLLGGRAGYLYSSGGHASFDAANLDAHVGDISLLARVQYEWIGSQVVGRLGFDVELGPAFGSIILRGTATGFASVRLAGTFFVGFGARARLPAIVFRLGAQYLPHEGPVMGGAPDAMFAGGIFGSAIEAPL